MINIEPPSSPSALELIPTLGNSALSRHKRFPDHLLLNLAAGGQWPGYPDATTYFPQQMLVDYVRVYTQS